MYNINSKTAMKIESVTFSDLDMREDDVEEILRNSIDMLCNEEESMLIVGQQVENEKHGRSDLTAIDHEGNIVLVEIKRDKRDIQNRKEAFEFQAIRYAASYATIESVEDIVKKVYAPYIERNRQEYELGELTPYELGIRKINEFLRDNNAENIFNEKQRIILVASDYDEQTLSAVAWLNSNNVDISCFKLIPYKINNDLFINAEKILPLTDYDDFYVSLMDKASPKLKQHNKTVRRILPKIDSLLDWGVVKEGDILIAKNRDDEATLLNNGDVLVDGKDVSIQMWLKGVYGWSSVATYAFAVHKETGKTLSQIREKYMNQQSAEAENGDGVI